MVSESQQADAIRQIEHALVAMRAGRGMRGRGAHPDHEAHRARRGEGTPPWGDGPPPWGDGPPWARGHGGPRGMHERGFGGAALFRMLEALLEAERAEKRMGVSEVAESIGVDQPRASRLVNAAADRGLVTRRADERDARRSVIALTAAGKEHLSHAHETRRSAVTDAVAGFTPEETAQFAALLTRFVAAWPRLASPSAEQRADGDT